MDNDDRGRGESHIFCEHLKKKFMQIGPVDRPQSWRPFSKILFREKRV